MPWARMSSSSVMMASRLSPVNVAHSQSYAWGAFRGPGSATSEIVVRQVHIFFRGISSLTPCASNSQCLKEKRSSLPLSVCRRVTGQLFAIRRSGPEKNKDCALNRCCELGRLATLKLIPLPGGPKLNFYARLDCFRVAGDSETIPSSDATEVQSTERR